MLTVTDPATNIGSVTRWLVRCDCGSVKKIRTNQLTDTKRIVSCGCRGRELFIMRITSHQRSRTREYRAWQSMHQRCYNKKAIGYRWWGGRGVRVCKKWHKFEGFFEDMGECLPGMTLDRIDNDAHYCKSNCRWAPKAQQRQNQRNNNGKRRVTDIKVR